MNVFKIMKTTRQRWALRRHVISNKDAANNKKKGEKRW